MTAVLKFKDEDESSLVSLDMIKIIPLDEGFLVRIEYTDNVFKKAFTTKEAVLKYVSTALSGE